MKRALPVLLLALAALPAWSGRASGEARPALDLEITGITGPARQGVPVQASLTFRSALPTTLRGFSFQVRGTGVTSDAPESIDLPAGGAHTVNLGFTHGTNETVLEVEVTSNGRRYRFFRDLSQPSWDEAHRHNHFGFEPDLVPEPANADSADGLWRPGPSPLAATLPEVSPYGHPVVPLEQALKATGAGTQSTVTYTLRGYFRFQRPDGEKRGIDGGTFTCFAITPAGLAVPVRTDLTSPVGRYNFQVTLPADFPGRFFFTLLSDNALVHVVNPANSELDAFGIPRPKPYLFVTPEVSAAPGTTTLRDFLTVSGRRTRAMSMLTDITRGFRWIYQTAGFTISDIDDLTVRYPDSDWPHYVWPLSETIYVPDGDWAWDSGTMLHEFGHHVNYELPGYHIENSDYDDGVCNNDNGDPGHCRWCEEADDWVAVGEGVPNWLADLVLRTYPTAYDGTAFRARDFETIECQSGNRCDCEPDPYRTEGYLSALLRDLGDGASYADTGLALATGAARPRDLIAQSEASLLRIFTQTPITRTQDFVNAWLARHQGNYPKHVIWNTFATAGFDLDQLPPGRVQNLRSTSHTPNVASADGTISVAWDPPSDDWSGAYEYTLRLVQLPAAIRQQIKLVEPSSLTYTFAEQAPGSYEVRVVARDRSGRMAADDPDWEVAGPFVVREPYPTDLVKWVRTGWFDALVPRATTGASSSSVTLSPVLPGNQDSTYFNWAIQNGGEDAPNAVWRTRLLVDGVPVDSVSVTTVGGVVASTQTVLNRGPRNIRGGRHTVEAWADASEVVAELSETNNRFGRQFVWRPLTVARNTTLTRSAPPLKNGGHNSFSVPIGQTKFANCDGLRFSHVQTSPFFTVTNWMAVELHAAQAADDYDLMLHYASEGAESGFTNGLATSSRGPLRTDALITNYGVMSESPWDVGVVNENAGTGDYRLRVNSGSTLAAGDSVTLTLGEHQMLVIRGLNVSSAFVGKLTAEVRRTAGEGQLNLAWFGPSFGFGTLDQAGATGATDAGGIAKVSFEAPAAALHGLVVYRDPSQGTAPVSFVLKTYAKPVDVAHHQPAGWAAPLVPRPAGDATSGGVPDPVVLHGDSTATWLNFSWRNLSDVSTGIVSNRILLDGATVLSQAAAATGGGVVRSTNNSGPISLPGGRHVLALQLDWTGAYSELSETNNVWGEQWVWTPRTLPAGAARWRAGQVGGPTEGWEFCPPDAALYFDQDGVRLPQVDAASGIDWVGLALMPRPGSDVDLFLYETRNDAGTGFDDPIESSNWGEGGTDLLLLNFSGGFRQPYDVGIQRVTPDTASYLVEFVAATPRSASEPVHGPFALAADRVLHLHQFDLAPGQYTVTLRHLGGAVDWGLAVHAPVRPWQDRMAGEETGWSFAHGPGADESVSFTVPQAGRHVVAVYKTTAEDRAQHGDYRLEIGSVPVAVDDAGPVVRTRLAPAYPNPFRGGSTLRFDLAEPGEVSLEVFDVRGARVRTLARGAHAAGRHGVMWDGADDRGRPLPAGLYMVRLAAPGFRATAKLVRVE